MSHKLIVTPLLQEGLAYTIILKDGRKVRNAIYYACVASGKPYFGKGNEVYPAEEVQSHSLIGHNVPEDFWPAASRGRESRGFGAPEA